MERFFNRKDGSRWVLPYLVATLMIGAPLLSIAGDGGDDDEGSSGHNRNFDAEDVARMYACGYAESPPLPASYGQGRYNSAWADSKNAKIYPADTFAGYFGGGEIPEYKDPYCELYVFKQLLDLGRGNELNGRCSNNRVRLKNLIRRGEQNPGRGGGTLTDYRSGASRSSTSRDRRTTSDRDFSVAKAFLYHTNQQRNSEIQRSVAQEIIDYCTDNGVRMDGSLGDYPNPYGYGTANCYSNGGTTIIKRQPGTFETILSAGLSFAKLYLPLKAMDKANERHEQNVALQAKYTHDLGFPAAIGAGGGGYGMMGGYGYGHGGGGCIGGGFGYGGCAGYGGGYGNGCIAGGGGCGGIYGGMNLGLGIGVGLGGYSGYSGGCPAGACYGNGGVQVGGSPYGMGGMCGIPPYSPYNQGCGGNYNPGLNRGPGNYFNGGGSFGPGGFNGGFNGGFGGGGFPGPWGTGNGGNGWGNGGQWGNNGTFGQGAFWGGGGANYGQVQNLNSYSNSAQQYQAMQQRQFTQAQAYQQYARRKEQELKDSSFQYMQAYGAAQDSAFGVGANQPSAYSWQPPMYSQPMYGNGNRGLQFNANVQGGI